MSDWLMDGVDQEPPTYCKLEGHEWEQIWDDGVGVRCCVCIHCGKEQIFEYEEEDTSEPAHEGIMDTDEMQGHLKAILDFGKVYEDTAHDSES